MSEEFDDSYDDEGWEDDEEEDEDYEDEDEDEDDCEEICVDSSEEEEDEDDYYEEEEEEEDYYDEEIGTDDLARKILEAFVKDPSDIPDIIRGAQVLSNDEINRILNSNNDDDSWFSKEMRKLS